MSLLLLQLLLASSALASGPSQHGYYAFRDYLLQSYHQHELLWQQQRQGQLQMEEAGDSAVSAAALALRQLMEPASARLVAMRALAELPPWQQPEEAVDSTACANNTAALLMGIAAGNAWALTFLDANAKPPAGLAYGGLLWLGSYDLCMTGASGPGFSGQFCLAPVSRGGGGGKAAGGLASPLLRLGLCWPGSCSSEQAANLTQLLLSAAQLLAGENATLAVLPSATECKRPRRLLPWTPQAIAMLAVLSTFASLVLTGTLYDLALRHSRRRWRQHLQEAGGGSGDGRPDDRRVLVNEAESPSIEAVADTVANGTADAAQPPPPPPPVPPGPAGKFLLCFSAAANAEKILEVSSDSSNAAGGGGTLTCVHGLRLGSMLWVLLGHTYYFAFPVLNNMGQLYSGWRRDWTFQAVASATLSVDTFFVLSGLLSTVLFLRELDRLGGRLGRFNWLMFYVHRYWRLTPPYLLVLASYVCLFQYVYEGPLYPQEPAGIDRYCPSHWWMNAAYVNNLAAPDGEQCMPWSWYLANDMQFYAVSPLFLALLARWPPVGLGALLAALLASVTAMGLYSSSHGLSVGFLGLLQEFSGVYIRPWFRAPPYLIGMLAGYALHRQLPRQRLAWPARLAVWLAAASLALSLVYGLYDVDGGRQTLSPGVASLYNAVYRPAWALAVAWVTVACVTGNGGWANRLLSAPALAPLSRLTYCAYLVHPVAMMAFSLSRRQAPVWDAFSVVREFLANVAVSYGLAFVASLLFESPLIGLERVLRAK